MSWVAITTEVPDLLSSMNSRSSRCARLGSTLPVGSSASRSCGRAITRARDRGTLLLATREHRRQRPHALAEADPVQQLDHLVAIASLVAPDHAQRQGDVLVGGHVIEQAEILEHDADAAAQRRQRILAPAWRRRGRTWVIRPRVGLSDRKRSRSSEVLPAPDGPGEELEGMRLDAEREVAQDLRPQAVAQADVLESDHTPLR